MNTRKHPQQLDDYGQPFAEYQDMDGMLGTKDGMRLAYGILWATWGDKNTAASIARHVLLSQLSQEDRAKGIEWACKILK